MTIPESAIPVLRAALQEENPNNFVHQQMSIHQVL